MPTLPTKSFPTLVANIISGMQGRAAKLVNFSIGSGLRAIVEGFAGILLWFQSLILELLTAIRLSTSSGTDVDTFVTDFMTPLPGSQTATLPGGSARLGSQASSGNVTFGRFTAGPNSVFIPVGATVNTNDGNNTQFAVMANTTFATYSATPSPGGYTLAANVANIIVPVQCSVPGIIGNIQPGTLSVPTSPITGIDTVTNTAAFINGADQESDSALKRRFAAYILGLSRGDVFGLNASVEGAAVNVQWTLTEGYDFNGTYHPGFFFVVADDGSGSPSAAFLAIVMAAAQAVRPLTIQCAVFPPTVVLANVSMQLTTVTGYVHNVVVAQVTALIALNINSLGLGNELAYNQLSAWAYSIPGVTLVSAVLLNGGIGDVANIQTTKLTQDANYNINYITIKAGVIAIS